MSVLINGPKQPSIEDRLASMEGLLHMLAQNNNALFQIINNISWSLEYIVQKLEEKELLDTEELKQYIQEKAEEFQKQLEELQKKPQILVAEVGGTSPVENIPKEVE